MSASSVRPGDKVLLSGPIGDHGITILLARGELDLEADLRSDTRSVLPLVQALVRAAGPGVRWMRDPTRGGVATSLNELARDCGHGVVLFEEKVPLRDAVRGACEFLGLDPLHIANEGQFLAIVAAELADAALQALREAPGGDEARNNWRGERTTCQRRSRHHPLWRHAAGGYARWRSAASHLLGERLWPRVANLGSQIEQKLLARNAIC